MRLVEGVWLPSQDTHLEKIMRGRKSSFRDGKLTYQVRKLDKAMTLQTRFNVCIDIGAHVGLWSMWLVKLFEQVHAFEPVGLHEEIFHRNVPEALFHPFALGDENVKTQMRVPKHQSCTSYIDSSVKGIRDETHVDMDLVDVEMRTLDSFAFENVDFIKIDTEGYELNVVKGALETIKRWRPNIVVEQADLDVYYGQEPKAALKLLESLGMTCDSIMGPDHIMVWE